MKLKPPSQPHGVNVVFLRCALLYSASDAQQSPHTKSSRDGLGFKHRLLFAVTDYDGVKGLCVSCTDAGQTARQRKTGGRQRLRPTGKQGNTVGGGGLWPVRPPCGRKLPRRCTSSCSTSPGVERESGGCGARELGVQKWQPQRATRRLELIDPSTRATPGSLPSRVTTLLRAAHTWAWVLSKDDVLGAWGSQPEENEMLYKQEECE